VSRAPQSPQYFSPGSFGAWQLGHATVRDVPHSAQNLRPILFSAPQLEQTTPAALLATSCV